MGCFHRMILHDAVLKSSNLRSSRRVSGPFYPFDFGFVALVPWNRIHLMMTTHACWFWQFRVVSWRTAAEYFLPTSARVPVGFHFGSRSSTRIELQLGFSPFLVSIYPCRVFFAFPQLKEFHLRERTMTPTPSLRGRRTLSFWGTSSRRLWILLTTTLRMMLVSIP